MAEHFFSILRTGRIQLKTGAAPLSLRHSA